MPALLRSRLALPCRRRFRRLRAAPLLLPLLAFALTACDRGSHPDRLQKPAPLFVVSDGTQSLDLSKFRGRIVVLNLWASWCAPCVDELPSLLRLQEQMPQLAIIGVSLDENDAAYRAFLRNFHVTFPNVRDPSGRVNALYGTVKIPETYVIGRDGTLLRKYIDAQNWTSPEIVRYLQHL